jgi:hypothetical protein
MATALKVLGQATPSTSLTDIYTVPAATQTAVSSIVVCNITTVVKTYRVAVRPAGASINNKHYLAYDAPISKNATMTLVLGIALAATDVISVYGSDTNVQFSVFGQEIT